MNSIICGFVFVIWLLTAGATPLVSGAEIDFVKRQGMGCVDVIVHPDAVPLNCKKFMAAWNRAEDLYERRVEGVGAVRAAHFRFIKAPPGGLDRHGNPVFQYGASDDWFYGVFDGNSLTIYFSVEDAVMWEALHAIDFARHPFKVRKGSSSGTDEWGKKQLYRWQIIGHGTPDDPIVER